MEHSASHAGQPAMATTYNVNFQATGTLTAGSSCELTFVITEQRVGEPIGAFQPLHDRLMHLIIVDETLTYFAHVHPVLEGGHFRVEHVLPSDGRYKLWAEARPAGGDSVYLHFDSQSIPALPARAPWARQR